MNVQKCGKRKIHLLHLCFVNDKRNTVPIRTNKVQCVRESANSKIQYTTFEFLNVKYNSHKKRNEKKKKTEQKQNGNKTEKTLSGTDAEKGVWEKAADTIAGDNKLMGSVLKLVLSPITLLVGVGLLIMPL
ncbi:MAG: hypothetical protein IPG89_19175 [Bacteroidetes bacterium]|nr:hypothetical protein [Bacteroidota bacterium]